MPDPGHRRRPPWWPDGEPWPPRRPPGRDAWGSYGRHFAKAAFLFVMVLVLVGVGVGAVAGLALGGGSRHPLVVAGTAVGILILVGLLRRPARRTWRPIRSLVEAMGRLADGDLAARVDVEGPRPLRRAAESFNRMAERLETESDRRRRLLADVGHELRTPLSVIRGEIEAIADGIHPADPEHLGLLLDETEVMDRLLTDLRTLADSEAGVLDLHVEPLDVADLMTDVLHGFERRAEAAGVTMSVEPSSGVVVTADPIRLRQVFTNLAVNALRSMPEGGRLSAAVEEDAGAVVVTVADTGRGIPPDSLDAVFDRYVKASDSAGSGLGLAIVRDLVVAHGGSVSVTSRVGDGTVFTVVLPSGE